MFTVMQCVTPVRSQLVEIELIYIDEFNFIELKLNFVLYKPINIYTVYIFQNPAQEAATQSKHFGGHRLRNSDLTMRVAWEEAKSSVAPLEQLRLSSLH